MLCYAMGYVDKDKHGATVPVFMLLITGSKVTSTTTHGHARVPWKDC